MKKLLLVATMALCLTAKAQQVTNAPIDVTSWRGIVGGWLLSNDASITNLYATKEVQVRLGAVYSQQDGDAAALLSLQQVGLIAKDVGFGFSIAEKNSGTAAFWGFLSYRKPLGNVCGSVFAGAGFDKERSSPMGVIGGQVEYRLNSHVGSFVSLGYALEDFNNSSSNGRGLILGGGVTYNF